MAVALSSVNASTVARTPLLSKLLQRPSEHPPAANRRGPVPDDDAFGAIVTVVELRRERVLVPVEEVVGHQHMHLHVPNIRHVDSGVLLEPVPRSCPLQARRGVPFHRVGIRQHRGSRHLHGVLAWFKCEVAQNAREHSVPLGVGEMFESPVGRQMGIINNCRIELRGEDVNFGRGEACRWLRLHCVPLLAQAYNAAYT